MPCCWQWPVTTCVNTSRLFSAPMGGFRRAPQIILSASALRGQHAVMQMAEQLHELVTALHIHQKTSKIAMVPVRLRRLLSIVGHETSKFAPQPGVQLH